MSPEERLKTTALLWLTCLAPSGMASRSIHDCQQDQRATSSRFETVDFRPDYIPVVEYNCSVPRGGSIRFPLTPWNWTYISKKQIYKEECKTILYIGNGNIHIFNSTFKGHFSFSGHYLIVDQVTDFLQGGYEVRERSTPKIRFHISLKPDPRNNARRASSNHLTCCLIFSYMLFFISYLYFFL